MGQPVKNRVAASMAALWSAFADGTFLMVLGVIGLVGFATEVKAAITIPNTIDVDGLGTTVLAAMAPGVISIASVSGVLFLVGLGILVLRRRSKRIAS